MFTGALLWSLSWTRSALSTLSHPVTWRSILVQCVHKVPSGFWKIVAHKQIELATCGLRQIIVKLWKFFTDLSRLRCGLPWIFELLPCSVEHVCYNSRDRILDTGLHVIKSVNWCSEHIALDITPQEKNPVVLCLVNVETKALDRLCRSVFLEMSCPGARVPAQTTDWGT
jgi:hypothetical protein